jgi:hypothetical protein
MTAAPHDEGCSALLERRQQEPRARGRRQALCRLCVDFLRCSDGDEVHKESASRGAGESKSSAAGTSARTSMSEKGGRQEGKGGRHADKHDKRLASPLWWSCPRGKKNEHSLNEIAGCQERRERKRKRMTRLCE